MKKLSELSIYLLALALVFVLQSYINDDDSKTKQTKQENVLELAMNQVKTNGSVEFEAKRTAFLDLLKKQNGVVKDKRFDMFFNYATGAAVTKEAPIVIGMTQYKSLETFNKIAGKLLPSTEAAQYFKTFDQIVFTVLKPSKSCEEVNLASMCSKDGQILEIAVRDVSGYKDMADYETKRDAFLKLLSKQAGFVKEYQWVSADGKNYAVGMTVYENQQSFFAIAGNKEFTGSQAYTDFMGTYPPIAGGMHNPK